MQPAISKAPDRIASMFDAIAGRYDLLNHVLSAGIDRSWRRRAIAALSLSGAERVLDLCTGTADLAIAARTASPGAARVVGVDFAGAMLRLAAGKVRQTGLAGAIALVRGDAAAIPVRSGWADAATIAFGIRNVPRIDAALKEAHRPRTKG